MLYTWSFFGVGISPGGWFTLGCIGYYMQHFDSIVRQHTGCYIHTIGVTSSTPPTGVFGRWIRCWWLEVVNVNGGYVVLFVVFPQLHCIVADIYPSCNAQVCRNTLGLLLSVDPSHASAAHRFAFAVLRGRGRCSGLGSSKKALLACVQVRRRVSHMGAWRHLL